METNVMVQDKKNNIAYFSVIQNRIYEIRGQSVMLDFDLAERYEVETAQLKRQVRRNIERFEGEDCMFQLTKKEFEILRCQIGTSSWGGTRYYPFAFTELGVAMLSSVLNSEKAIKVNKDIMRVFVFIRRYGLNFAELKHELDDFMRETKTRLEKNDMKFEAIFNLFDKFMKQKQEQEKPRTPIGFKQNNEDK
jgi:hypothetical protein